MAKDKRWTFTVSGVGHFPLDMLRYDGCFPADGGAVTRIQGALDYVRMPNEPVEIRLVSLAHAPTEGRWRSFGWHVSETQGWAS